MIGNIENYSMLLFAFVNSMLSLLSPIKNQFFVARLRRATKNWFFIES